MTEVYHLIFRDIYQYHFLKFKNFYFSLHPNMSTFIDKTLVHIGLKIASCHTMHNQHIEECKAQFENPAMFIAKIKMLKHLLVLVCHFDYDCGSRLLCNNKFCRKKVKIGYDKTNWEMLSFIYKYKNFLLNPHIIRLCDCAELGFYC